MDQFVLKLLTLGYAPIGEESRAGYYPHDGESPAPVNLTGLDARLILGLIKFEGLNESFDQMADVSLVSIGNAVSGPSDVVSEAYNLIPDGVDDADYNTATGGEAFGADPLPHVNPNLSLIGPKPENPRVGKTRVRTSK